MWGVAVAGRRSRVLEQLEVAVGVAVHDEVGLKRHVWYTGMVAAAVCYHLQPSERRFPFATDNACFWVNS